MALRRVAVKVTNRCHRYVTNAAQIVLRIKRHTDAWGIRFAMLSVITKNAVQFIWNF